MNPLRRLSVACVLFLAPLLAPAQDQDAPPPPPGDGGRPVSYQAFYDGLAGAGRWVTISGYGSCWQPYGADAGWAPYVEGHWTYTEDGWTWVSDEPWGWAVYHYGRWILTPQGWFWVPGYTWGPCWVRWQYGNGYCGWAPLPPQGVAVSARWYNFCHLNDIGFPRLREVVLERGGNAAYLGQTSGGFHRRGPDIEEINGNAFRKVPRLSLRRSSGPVPAAPRQAGNDLPVYAPEVRPPANNGPWHPTPAPHAPGAPSRHDDHGSRPDRHEESHPAPAPAPRPSPAPPSGGVRPSGGTTPNWIHH